MQEMPVNSSALFRKNVLSVIKERGITITQLAEKAETSRPAMSRILSGIDGVTLERADRVAHALGLEVSDLLAKKMKIPAEVS
ncbi:MAG: XRE family transcriptional regulator [Desulfurellales bacterium]|nr:MAG: XRE family transcriptional regulator [Desulfurellales bacterium]